MLYLFCTIMIVATHYFLKENKKVLTASLWQLLLVAVLLIGLAAVISTWVHTLFPVIMVTLVFSSTLQIKYSHQVAKMKG